MARKSPARVRAELRFAPGRADSPLYDEITWLSARGRLAVARLERDRGWAPGSAASALLSWALFVRDPMHRLWLPGHGCGVWECCPDPAQLRAVLAAVASVLPTRDAREFRRRVAVLDERW